MAPETLVFLKRGSDDSQRQPQFRFETTIGITAQVAKGQMSLKREIFLWKTFPKPDFGLNQGSSGWSRRGGWRYRPVR